MSELIPGGWKPFITTISPEAMKVFKEATKDILGVQYTPLAVSTQVVRGLNYDFFCDAAVVKPNAKHYAAMVRIYVSADHVIKLGRIEKIEHKQEALAA